MNAAIMNAREHTLRGKEQYNHKYVRRICVVLLLSLLLRSVSDIGFYVFAGVSLVVFIASNPGHCFTFLLFLLPFASIQKQSVDGMSVFAILFFLTALKLVIKYSKINTRLLVLLLAFFIFCLWFSGFEQITTILTMITGVLLLYYIRERKLQVDIQSVVIVYSVGLCLASVLALFKASLPLVNEFIKDAALKLGISSYASRFAGLHGNPNYYTIDVTVALSAIAALMTYKRKTTTINIVLLVALSVFGLMSVSKSFVLGWVFLLLVWFFLSAKQGVDKFVKLSFVIAIGTLVVYYYAYDSINLLLFRFTSGGVGVSWDDMTTGRLHLWESYWNAIFGDAATFLFGQGLNTIIASLRKGPHNTFLELLFNLGIVGSSLLLSAIHAAMGNIKIKGAVWIPLLVLLLRMLAIGILAYDNLWFYLAIIVLLACDYAEMPKNTRGTI